MLDRHGTKLAHATPDAAAAYDRAVEAFSLFHGDPIAALDEAAAAAPAMALAPVAKALLFALATEPGANRAAGAMLDSAALLPPDPRAASLAQVTRAILAGEWTRAAALSDAHNADFPRDLLALQAGHLVDFFRADAVSLRARIDRALPHWPADLPGRSVLLGMRAFGLEESGDYAEAEESGRAALAAEPRDAWAHHAVAHVMEMQGRAGEGIAWMSDRAPHWASEACFFRIHNWWHRSLFHLELGQVAEALALYDTQVRATPSPIAVNLIDAAALLWRIELSGGDAGPRWGEVAQAWARHADGATYPFNDWHATLADLGAGREREVEARLARMRQAAAAGTETARWIGRIGIPLVEGFRAFRGGDHAQAVALLHPIRTIAAAFGGSHAQRDLIDWTLTEAAIRANRHDLAQTLAGERRRLKPQSPLAAWMMRRAEGKEGVLF